MGEDGYPKILYRDGEYQLVFLAQGKDGWAKKEVVNDVVSSHSLSFSRKGSEYYAFYNTGDKFIRFRKRSSNGWSDEEVFAKAKELPYGLLYWTSSNRNSDGWVGVAWDEGRAGSWVLKFKKMDW
jgi:hypothetical protein